MPKAKAAEAKAAKQASKSLLGGARGLLINALLAGFMGSVLRAMWQNRDLPKALAFYGSYHQDPMNQLIHFIFVPMLLWSFIMMLHYIPLLGCFVSQDLTLFGHRLTYGTLTAAAYSLYYPVLLDPVGGSMYTVVVLAFYASANALVEAPPRDAVGLAKKSDAPSLSPKGAGATTKAIRVAVGCQVLGWYMQIHPGHAVFEGVKPALLDALGQSLSVAPLFAFYEGVWAAGLHMQLHAQTATLVSERRAAMCVADRSKYRFCL